MMFGTSEGVRIQPCLLRTSMDLRPSFRTIGEVGDSVHLWAERQGSQDLVEAHETKKKLLLWFLTVLVAGSITFCAAEILTRVARPQLTYSKLLSVMGSQWVDGDFIPFTLKRNYVAQAGSLHNRGTVTVSINSLGLRGPEIAMEKPPKTRRILILGDSYTFGLYCSDDEVYPRVLERLNANHRPRIQVLNAGFTDGLSPDEHYAWLVNRGLAFQPDVVVYGFFIGNDLDDINARHWVSLDKRGLPARTVNPDVYVDAVGRIRSRIADAKTVGDEVVFKVPLLRESHLLVFLNREVARHRRHKADTQQTETTSKGNNGWGEVPFDPILSPQVSQRTLSQLQLLFRLVQGMRDASQEMGAKYLLLMIPVNFQVESDFLSLVLGSDKFRIQRDFFTEMEPTLQGMNVQYLNLLEAMKRRPEQKYYPRNGEVHFDPNGHRFAAEMIQKKLEELGWQ